MTSRIRTITIDSHRPYELSRFWSAALGYVDHADNPNRPDDPEALLVDPQGLHPNLLFVPVPEPKATKNRVHLDLVPDLRRDLEVERLVGLGATLVDDHRRADGAGWAVLADPEGNEFCIERSVAERPEPLPIDTGERPFPPLFAADERTMLDAMLEWYRAGVLVKVAGLSQAHAVATPLRTSTSIAGLVKHLSLVEDSWLSVRFAGGADPEVWAGVDWDADPDWEFHSAADDPIEHLVDIYRGACGRSRAVVAGRSLDDVGADTSRREFTLRFVYLHLIEETARHLGHLDILRELLDGTTGE